MHTSQETIWQSTDLKNDMKAHIELLEILAEAEADGYLIYFFPDIARL